MSRVALWMIGLLLAAVALLGRFRDFPEMDP